MVRFHGGDDGIDSLALEGVDGRGPGAVDMAKLGNAGGHAERAPVLDPVLAGNHCLRSNRSIQSLPLNQ